MIRQRVSSMTLNQLRIFAAVARNRSFARASDELCISQPAVSGQIRSLESLLGMRLLTRSPGHKRIDLTEAGAVLLHSYDEISLSLERAGRALEALRGLGTGIFAFGTGPGFGTYIFPRVHDAFRRLYPGIKVRVEIDVNPNLLKGLREGRLELAVMVAPDKVAGFRQETLGTYEVLLVGLPGHRLAGPKTVPFTELSSEQLLLPTNTVALRSYIDRLASETGTELQIGLEVDYIEARIQSVLDGFGIAAVSSYSVAAALEAGQLALLNVEGFPIRLDWCIVQRNGDISPAAEAFRAHLLGYQRFLSTAQRLGKLREKPDKARGLLDRPSRT